jgi:hypothetical protein
VRASAEYGDRASARHLSPMEWVPTDTIKVSSLTIAFVEALNRADLH